MDIILDGLDIPEGLVVAGGNLFIVEASRKQLLSIGLDSNQVSPVAFNLPVGAPAGVIPKLYDRLVRCRDQWDHLRRLWQAAMEA